MARNQGNRMLRKRKKIRTIQILSQNVRGIKTVTRTDLLFNVMKGRNAIAACLQETWRSDFELLEHDSFKLISSGLDKNAQLGKRGSQGVAILLNPDGVNAWKEAGYEKHIDLGARVIGVRLLLRDREGRNIGLFLISAYAPVGTAPEDEWDNYLDKLTECISRKKQNDILVIGTDTNSSMGISNDKDDPVGSFGISHINESGRRFRSYLSMNNLSAMSTRFMKREFATWIHPRSKQKHQIDHFLVNREMSHRIMDTGITTCLLDSDHRAISIKVRVMKRLKKKSIIDPRQKMLKLNLTELSDSKKRNDFCQNVINRLDISHSPNYTELAEAVKESSLQTLSKQSKNQPGWFRLNRDKLLSSITVRNQAMSDFFKRCTRSTTSRLRKARKELKTTIKTAKNKWINDICDIIDRHEGTKKAWDSLKTLKTGLSKTTPSSIKQMRKTDGSYCSSAEENAEVFRQHFQLLYNRPSHYDLSILDSLPQHEVFQGCDHVPTNEEIRKATLKLKNTAPGESGISPQIWKTLLDNDVTKQYLQTIIKEIWISENIPKEWDIGRLTILPKKGDLSLTTNYRGIMLLEVAYKIIAIILHSRLLPIQEGLDHEPQCGFRPERGCTDAIYTVKSALKKRREHGKE